MNKKTITRLHGAVDQLFERMKDKFLGARLVDKQLALTTDRPDLTLSGLAVSAAASEGAIMTPQSLNSLMHIASSYMDAAKERAKAEVVMSVSAFQASGADPDVALGGALSATWEKITNDVIRIVDSEAQRGRTMGAIEGITAMNLSAGIDDPTVYFVVVRDGHRCGECTRLHLLDDEMTPRCWKMSEIGTGYHKKGQPNPKMHGLHPHCRCSPATLLPGYGFGPGGMVKFIAPGHDEYARQRGGEQPLAKAEQEDSGARQIRQTLDKIHKVREGHLDVVDNGGEPEVHPLVPIDPSEFSRCTSTACFLAQTHGGKVMGYEPDDDVATGDKPKTRIGDLGGGHDFAVIGGRYLADYWAKDYEELPDLYDMANPAHRELVHKHYGNPADWKTTYDFEANPREKNPWMPKGWKPKPLKKDEDYSPEPSTH